MKRKQNFDTLKKIAAKSSKFNKFEVDKNDDQGHAFDRQSRAFSDFLEEKQDTKKHRETADGAEKSDAPASFGVFRFFRESVSLKMRSGGLKIFAILAVILLVQTFLMIHYGAKKSGFHVDEIFTFNSSMNNPYDWYGQKWYKQKRFINSWLGGDVYCEFMSVNSKNRFHYRTPYVNQKGDVHPPLYYMAVHTICSIFPGVFWKWPGLSINFFFSLISTLLLYLLAKEIGGSDSFSLFASAFWAWSSGALSCAMFLRMYAMLTMWMILLALLHVRFFKSVDNDVPIEKSTWNGLFLTTAAGILTQYYFLVFCFFLCGFAFIYLIRNKKRDLVWRYVKTEFAALAVSYFIFPRMRKHIFKGYRGKEAFSNFSKGGEWWQNLTKVTDIIYRQLFRWPILPSIVLLVLIFLIAGYLLRRKKATSDGKDAAFFFLFLIAVLYVLLISKIAPFRTDRYYFCIYPFFVLPVLYVLYKSGTRVLSKKPLAVIFVGILALQLLGSANERNIGYLFKGTVKRQEILSRYVKYPAIFVPEEGKRWMISSYLYEFGEFPVVYGCKEIDGLKTVKENGGEEYLKNDFVLYAIGFGKGFTDEKFIQDVSEYLPISEWERIKGIGGCPVYFCRTEAK